MNIDPNTGRVVYGGIIERDMRPAPVLTVRQAAAHYGVSITTIYRRARAGRLIATKNQRGHWVITGTGTTLDQAQTAADLRDSLKATAALAAAPIQGPIRKPFTPDYSDMHNRRRAALNARRELANA